MVLPYEMVCEGAASFGVAAETEEKRQHVQFASSDSHIVLSSAAPLGLESSSLLPRQKYTGRKEISRHKGSLCNAVKLH